MEPALRLPIYHRWKGRTPKWQLTPEIEAQIRRVYRESTGDGEIRDLAKRLGIPRWRISRWALHLGVVEPRRKEPDWNDAEIAVLKRWAHLTPERIQIRLKSAGFHRSVMGIFLKRKRMRFLRNLDGYTSRQLAECFGVSCSKTVTRWIELGHLKAERRGTNRLEIQGGDMWFIREKDVRQFIIESIALIDIRKVDKFWFVDLLARA
jgi:hypothetical protein